MRSGADADNRVKEHDGFPLDSIGSLAARVCVSAPERKRAVRRLLLQHCASEHEEAGISLGFKNNDKRLDNREGRATQWTTRAVKLGTRRAAAKGRPQGT